MYTYIYREREKAKNYGITKEGLKIPQNLIISKYYASCYIVKNCLMIYARSLMRVETQ